MASSYGNNEGSWGVSFCRGRLQIREHYTDYTLLGTLYNPYMESCLLSSLPGELLQQACQVMAEPDSQEVVLEKKSPPPELPESIRIRSLVILSFWAVVVCLGLPIWWRTTSIYRARLPLQDMLEWADGKVLQCWPTLRTRRALTLLVAGMSSGVSIADMHRSPFSTRVRRTASDTDHPARLGRFE